METKRKEICEANGHRLLEVVGIIDGIKKISFQIINPNFETIGEPYSTINESLRVFRVFLSGSERVFH